MKTSKAYYHNGLFRFLEGDGWPVKPDERAIYNDSLTMPGSYPYALNKYNEALQAALDKSIPYEDQEAIKKMTEPFPSDGLYSFPEIEVEVTFNFKDPCPQCGDDIRNQSKGQCLVNWCYKGQPGFERYVAHIVPQSSELSVNSEGTDKPDFESIFSAWHPVAAAEHLWKHQVIPRDAEIDRLKTIISGKTFFDEKEALEAEIQRLKSDYTTIYIKDKK
jgi:hypothetical protein